MVVADISVEVLKMIEDIGKSCHSQNVKMAEMTGLSEVQVLILREIQNHGSINSARLNKLLKLSPYRTNVQIDYLIHKKLIDKSRDLIDKRAWNLMLSLKASTLLESTSLIRQRLMSRFSHLPSCQQTQILSTLEYLSDLIDI